MDQLCDFSDFLWLFMAFLLWGFFWQWRRPFLGTSLNIIYVDNGQGFLEHVSDFLYLEWFWRYSIETLSRTFENRLFKLLKTLSKCIKLPGLFNWLNLLEIYFPSDSIDHETKVVPLGHTCLLPKNWINFIIFDSVFGCCTVKSIKNDVQKSYPILMKLKT